MKKRVTRADVAALAGVSQATVSYAINGKPGISPETVERVRDAISALGYVPNQAARALRGGSSKLLAVMVPDLSNAFFAESVRAVEDAADEQGYTIMVASVPNYSPQLLERLRDLTRRGVETVLLYSDVDSETVRIAIEEGIAIVSVNPMTPHPLLPTVAMNVAGATRDGIGHLTDRHGYTRVGFVGETSTRDLRFTVWMEELRHRGLPTDAVFTTGFDRRSAYHAGVLLAKMGNERPQAIFAASDQILSGVVKGMSDAGTQAGPDIAVLGFDGTVAIDYLPPGFSLVRQPIRGMAHEAVRLAVEQPNPSMTVVLEGKLELRASCGCPFVPTNPYEFESPQRRDSCGVTPIPWDDDREGSG